MSLQSERTPFSLEQGFPRPSPGPGYSSGPSTQAYNVLGGQSQSPLQGHQGLQMATAEIELLHNPFANGVMFRDAPGLGFQAAPYAKFGQLFQMEGLLQNQALVDGGAGADVNSVSEGEDVPIGRGLKRPKPANPSLTVEGFRDVKQKHLETRKKLKLIQEGIESVGGLIVKDNGGLLVQLDEPKAAPISSKKPSAEKPKRVKKGKVILEGKDEPIRAASELGEKANEIVPSGTALKSPEEGPQEKKKRKYVRKQKPGNVIALKEDTAGEEDETAVKEEAGPGRQGSEEAATLNVERSKSKDERPEPHKEEEGQSNVLEEKEDPLGAAEAVTPGEKERQVSKVVKRAVQKLDPLEAITEENAGVLDLGWGVHFLIPPFYDDLAPKLGLPTFDMTEIDEKLLAGGMRSAHLAALIREETHRRNAKQEALEKARAPKAAAKEFTPLGRRVPDGQRCQVCRGAKKGGCGSLSAHPRCQKRAQEGFPFNQENQEDGPPFKDFADPMYYARGGPLQTLQSVPPQNLMPPEIIPQLHPDQLAMLMIAGQRGLPLDVLRIQAELAASALAWQAMPQGALQAAVPTPQRTQSPQIDPATAAKNEQLRLKLKLAKDPVVKEKEDTARVKRLWQSIAKRDIPKQHRAFTATVRKQTMEAKRVAELCQREVKARGTRSQRVARLAGQRTRRLARDMVLFWKKMDREAAEQKKQEEREAAAALRREEELREARRQQQRLNFLLTQTELYSHFMRNQGIPQPAVERSLSIGATPEDAEENARLQEEASQAAQAAAAKTQDRTSAFDSEVHRLREQVADPFDPSTAPENAEDIDLLNPSTMPEVSTVLQPKMFLGKLKEYQLKGVQWLVNLYEQGLNGILADEMGLGKTIQAMSFLGHLAEEKGIWGPFIVVSPASTLPNWVDELGRFCPELKVLPYWGAAPERAVLRKNLNPKRLYRKESAFHVCVTSYQLIVADEKYLKRVKWQYMVLDEAQAIKSASSQRWKSMLSFNCRNRLLLTGTPIQNSMAELWALLHFIMPTLFDSHEQFNEWFSKGIEGHAEGVAQLNEHQLTRLHAVLKPFMLRRVKKDVESEMTGKKEVTIPCALSARQQALYRAIKHNISIADLFDGAASDKQMLRLMNIVIQLRKVCNHPELFERNEARLSYTFCVPPVPLQPAPFGELDWVAFPGCRNPVKYHIPKLLYREGTLCLPPSSSGTPPEACSKWLHHQLSIFSPENIHQSLFHDRVFSSEAASISGPALASGCFGFTRLIGLSPEEVSYLAQAPLLERWAFHCLREAAKVRRREINEVFREAQEDPRTRCVLHLLNLPLRGASSTLSKARFTGPPSEPLQSLVTSAGNRLLDNARLLRSIADIIPPVQAPPVDSFCPDRSYAYQQQQTLFEPFAIRTLSGRARTSEDAGPSMPVGSLPEFPEENKPLMGQLMRVFGASMPMQAMDFSKMLTDSGKLQALDELLRRLRKEGHRVLIFAQMTSMMNILEDYLNFRKFKYLRLDGSSSIMDRRDMVNDFQSRSDIFVFLLSTRAGGLGINLTAADTVIFYESDWNPTMDLQAMDRAHRLGQTKEVTVYRMICKGTVEEKIVARAGQKNTVQQLVMTGQQTQADVFQPEEVMSLLLDDAEMEQQLKAQAGKQPAAPQKKRKSGNAPRAVRMLDNSSDIAVADVSTDVAARENTPGTSGDRIDVNSTGGDVSSNPPAKKRRKAEGPRPPRPPKAPKGAGTSVARKKGNQGSNMVSQGPSEEGLASGQGGALRLKIRPPPAPGSEHVLESEVAEDELHIASPVVKPHMKRQRSRKRNVDEV